MSNRTSRNILGSGFSYVKLHPQLIMTIVLAIAIPVAFLVSGQQFLGASSDNQERLEKDRIGLLHDMVAALLGVAQFDVEKIQDEIETLGVRNPDITQFSIGREEGNDVRIIVSLDRESVGNVADNPQMYRLANITPNESLISPYATDGVRYWHSVTLVRSPGVPDHYIYTETSLLHIDSLFSSRIMHAYYWLAVLLSIILYLLMRHVTLIDYSYLYKETKRAVEMKDLFTNMIAHELRAPLTAMRGYASMIRVRAGADDVTIKNAREIESAAGRLITIVSDLLDVARMQSGKLSIEQGNVHVSGVVRSVVEALHPSADEKQIALNVHDPHGTLIFAGDEKRFYQVLTNIVSNAIKYTKEGTITIELTDAKDRIELRVKDTGMGISSDNQKKMFAPFFRVEGEETATITGTGLGLWVTKELVTLMGGSIGVESIKGVGTHVILTFPKQSSEKS